MAKRKTRGSLSPAAIKALYDAAGFGRRMKGWNAPSSGPNKAVTGIQNIRNRSRDASRNDWSGESTVQKWTTNLIGVGITPRFKRIKSKERKLAITDLWNDFVAKSDADGVLNYYGQQTLAVRSWFESGEVFVRRRYRRTNSGLPVPMQVQLIEADFVPMMDSDAWPGLSKDNRIRSGIELDKNGQRVAYWVHKFHPGDGTTAIGGQDLIRVPAEDMRHVFEPKRPGQLRGVPVMASVLARLRNINDYDDAVLERQKLSNLFVAFITRTMPGADADLDIDPLTNLPIEWSGGEPLAGMQPGLTQELDPGQDVKFANPPEAGTTYSDYMRTNHMGTAAAAGIPYEVFSGDIANVSDRTLRVVIQEFRRFAEQRQWQIIIPMFCQPVVEWFADAAALIGGINADEIADVKRAEHAPHGWQYIHPVQDPQGKALEVTSGFRSRSSVIAERGEDPEAVDDERAADKEREDALGLTPVPVAPAGAPSDPNAPPDKKQAPSQLERAMTGLISSQIRAMQEKPVMQAAPVTNLTINQPAPVTNVHNDVPATTVVNNVEQPVVNVAAPNVNVAAPNVTVEAPNVQIENNVPVGDVSIIASMPTRKTETTVTYDSAGNIASSVQIESDVPSEDGK
jgi:lambda family phage portal protein